MYDSDLDFGLRSWDNYEDSLEHDWNKIIENDGGNKILKHSNETFDSALVDEVETDRPPKQKDFTLLRSGHRKIHSSNKPKYKCVKHYGREKGRCVKVRCNIYGQNYT